MIGDRAAAAALALLGLLVTFQASRLDYWMERAPGPGFLPLWLGVLLMLSSVVLLVRTAQVDAVHPKESVEARQSGPPTERLALAVITAVSAALVPLIGLIAATAVLTAAAAWRLDRRRPIANATATLLTPLLVWLVFVRWLGMPLP